MVEAQKALQNHIQDLTDIIGVARTVVSTLDLDKVLNSVLHNAMQFLEMPAGLLEVYNETTQKMVPRSDAGLSAKFVEEDGWRVSARCDVITKRAMHDGHIHYIPDLENEKEGADGFAGENIRSLICIPLLLKSRLLGVLYLFDREIRHFEQRQIELLEIFSSFAVMSIDNASLHTRTKRMAITDALTGLHNNRYFKQVFPYELSRARRYAKPLSLIMMDIDHFKQLNDTYGHPKGDQVLAALGKVLSGSLRSADFSFRYGGEEFAVLLPETRLEGAFLVAEALREKICRAVSPALGDNADQQVSVSLGVACFPNDGNTTDQLLKHADNCLYKAKKQGRNRVYWESGIK